MTDCTVSVLSSDGRTHTAQVRASSVFDAVDQAAQQWARPWWYRGDAVAEVRAGKRRWRVRLQTVRRWRAEHGAHRDGETDSHFRLDASLRETGGYTWGSLDDHYS